MEENNYWVKFWNTSKVIHRETPHEKVGRTINGEPIRDEAWQLVLNDLEVSLELHAEDDLLDIAAGSGVIALPFSRKVRSVTAVDISAPLLAGIDQAGGVTTVLADAREVSFAPGSFSKIVLYFALQHFSEKETVLLFEKMFSWLRLGGILYIGDIPDISKTFAFFNNTEHQAAYFRSLKEDSPIVGYWFTQDFLENLGHYTGFSYSQVLAQPSSYINAHYRFDARFVK